MEGQDFCSCRTFHTGLCLLQDTLASKKTFTDHSDTLFSLLLSDEGCEEFDIRRNREDAIICESMKTCEDKSWSSMLHLLGLSSVLNCCIESVYPIANEGFRPLFHQSIYPLETTSNIDREAKFGILWSRDGNLDNQPGFSFEPNHFALLIPDKEMAEVPCYQTSKVWQQPQLSSFFKEGTRTEKSTACGVGEVSGVTGHGSVDLWESATESSSCYKRCNPNLEDTRTSLCHTENPYVSSTRPKGDACAFDICDYVTDGISLDARTKIKIIENRMPPVRYRFPTTHYKDKRRKSGYSARHCKRVWLEKYDLLCYSQMKDGIYCLACILFLAEMKYYKDDSIFVRAPCRDWKYFLEYWQLHEQCQYHQNSKDKMNNFMSSHYDPSLRIDTKITMLASANLEKNVAIMVSIIKCLEFCGRQGIAIRGHRDDTTSTSINKGNFKALLDMRIDAGDDVLKQHLSEGPKNATYISKTAQNELLECIGDFIKLKILSEIKSQEGHNFFAIEADEIRDISNWEQLGIAVRYIKNHNAVERILAYVDCESTTGESICNAIVQCLKDCGLDPLMCRAQTYDGAGNMRGRLKGCRTLFLNYAPKAQYFHCASHILNLSLSQSCTQLEVQCMMSTLKDVALFFKYSPKRQRLLESCIETVNSERISAGNSKINNQKVKLLCETRWVERHTSLEEFEEMYAGVIECLSKICDAQSRAPWDSKTVTEARGLLSSISTPGFLCAFACNRYLFGFTRSLSLLLQGSHQDVVTAYQEIALIRDELKDVRVRADIEFKENVISIMEKLSLVSGTSISIPRRCNHQTLRGNVEAGTPEEYWRRTIFIPVVDHLISELTDRFQNLSQCAVRGLYLLPGTLSSLNDQVAL